MSAKLIDLPAAELLDKFGAGSHKPGSGSAAALQGMLSARLLRTVISLTKDPKREKHYSLQLPKLRKIEAAVEGRLIPSLERLFQEDSDQFDRAIQLRKRRENEIDPVVRRQLADQANSALIPATEIPIKIAKDCVELARFALEVFDTGFQSALGDSGVALNAAISAVSGSLSIVELNLRSFEASDWTDRIRASRDALMTELDELTEEARRRLASQILLTERKTQFSKELQAIAVVTKGKRPLPEASIEAMTVRLQRAMWNNKEWLWKNGVTKSALDILNPSKALQCFGLTVHRASTLGQYVSRGAMVEVAGQIDQPAKVVSISEQFPPETQNFTTAHELGHYLLHTQSVLHRDRPLNGLRITEPRDSEEWQADKFAIYFLMPTKLVKNTFSDLFLTEYFKITEETAFALNEQSTSALRSKCKHLRGLARLLAKTSTYNGAHVYPLSERFGVSVEAMAIRLEELKLVDF
jgi:formiminotetrahydrofolate cyclodeaminase/Zn-dependent peptidase ImmA (M78 family)